MRQGAQSTCMCRGSVWGIGSVDGLAIDAQLQLLADFEEWHALGRHGDDASGLWVASLTRLPLLDDEAAEAAHFDAIAAAQGVGHAAEHRVDDHLRIATRVTGIDADDFLDQVAFRHEAPHSLSLATSSFAALGRSPSSR